MPMVRSRTWSYPPALFRSLLFAGANFVGSVSPVAAGEPTAAHWIAAGAESIALDGPSAGVSARITPDGLTCSARSNTLTREARDVTVTVRTTSFGRVGAEHAIARGVLASVGERIELARGEFTEWFTPHASGVEQGWTISAAPAGDREQPLWIGLEFVGLAPRIDEQGRSARLVDERGQDRLYYRGLHAYDSSGHTVPARLCVRMTGVGIEVDDRGAAYPITVDPVLSGLAWSFQTDQAGAQLGITAWTAGDVNGDGFSDLVAGAPTYTQSLANEGAALVWFGPLSGTTSPPDLVLQASPPNANNQFGGATAVGDANGDGYEDIVVVAPGYSNGTLSEGGVYLYLGGPTGLTGSGSPFYEGSLFGAEIGRGVAAAGDVNADGFADVLVGSGTYDQGGFTDNGAAFLFLGSSTGYSSVPAWSAYGDRNAAQFGEHLAGVGDVDADGYDDWVVGAHAYANPEPDEGAAFLCRGSTTASISTTPVTWISEGNNSFAAFGNSVNAAGDVNGDGFADVLIGAPGLGTGNVFLYFGSASGLSNSPWQRASPSGVNETFGSCVATAGDVNGDGFADFLVAALNYQNQGRVLLYLGSTAGPITPPAAELLPNSFSALNGFACATAGDVNGDGLSDVLVGDPYYSNPQFHEGRVDLYLGQPSSTPLVTPLGGQTASLAGTAGSSFANALTTSGDVNGDGFSDLLVGAPDFDGAQTDEGRVLLFRGTANGLESTSIWSYSSGIAAARLGHSVAFAGDVDNDGYGDVLVGAPGLTNGQAGEGRAYLFLGTSSGALASTPDWTFESDQLVENAGASVAGAGDVDGDGYTDVFVGAPGATLSSIQNSGRVYVFKGSPTGLGVAPAIVVNAPSIGAFRFGASVANAGDVNRDGRTDLLVGAPDYTNGQNREGAAYLFLGSGNSIAPTPAFSVESESSLAALGTAVSAAGDVDSDGFADFVIGAPDFPGGGRVWLYRGQTGVVPIAPGAQVFSSPQSGSRFGASLARAGDVNNDGFSDFLIGAPNFNTDQGNVQLYLGTATLPALEFPGAAGAHLGGGLGPCGDVDGDGFSDVVLGQPGQLSGAGGAVIYMGSTQYGSTNRVQQRTVISAAATHLLALNVEQTNQIRLQGGPNTFANVRGTVAGRERVALEWEIKGGSALLDGTALAHGPFQDLGVPGSTPPATAMTLSEVVGGLTPSQRYQWRTRIATTNPLFPHTPWTQIQGNGQDEKKFGTGFDCNNNGIPDSTEVAANPSIDCNTNGAPDSCDIASGVDPDCDNDGTPNSCELFANNCNDNSIPDDCEVAAGGASVDCNANNVLDTCELSPATDANGDSVLDACQFVPFCFGDGTGTPCPCGNSGGAGRGCANSVNANGAVLTVTGVPSIGADTLVLHSVGMPNSAAPSSLYLQGTAQDNGGLGTPIQDGLRCVTGSLIRLGTRPNSVNQSQYPDVGNQIISIRGQLNSLTPPVTRYYQVFYRNAATAFCPPGTANWTNGLAVTWHL
ncbi:MAG: FG-GAP repeat protein [Planctomycetes bacterium]|nr:FG-GAP repeat protein [Planctomycetota bacterium]